LTKLLKNIETLRDHVTTFGSTHYREEIDSPIRKIYIYLKRLDHRRRLVYVFEIRRFQASNLVWTGVPELTALTGHTARSLPPWLY
jgi:hypothetical protein